MPSMRHHLLALVLAVSFAPGLAQAQYAPGSIGNAGRMPETMSPGALPPPLPVTPPASSSPSTGAPATSYGSRYPNTESLSRERIESQGYRVQQIDRNNDGSWNADVTRDAVPTRPQGVPSKITIHPDGRIEREF